jgi:putative transposase
VTTARDQSALAHPDLVDRAWATPSRPDQWRVADFIHVWTLAGFVYVSFVIDPLSIAAGQRRVRLSGNPCGRP